MAHRFIIDDGTTQTEAPDRRVPITDSRYSAVFRYDPGNGVTPVPHTFVLDYSAIGPGPSNTTLFFTQIPNAQEHRRTVEVRWNYTGDQPQRLRLFITTDLATPQQRWIEDFDPYTNIYNLDMAAKSLSLNQNYYLVLYAVDPLNNEVIDTVRAETATSFMFVNFGLEWINAPQGELREDEDVNVQWRTTTGNMPARVEVFASTANDGTAPSIPLLMRTTPTVPGTIVPMDGQIWNPAMTPSLARGVDYYVGIRALDASGAVITDVPAVYAPGRFRIRDVGSVRIRFTQPSTVEVKHPNDPIPIPINLDYPGTRPPSARIIVTDEPLSFAGRYTEEIVPSFPTSDGGDPTSWPIPDVTRLPLGRYYFVALGVDAAGVDMPGVRAVSLPFTVEEEIAPYGLLIDFPERNIPEGEALGVSWSYSGTTMPRGVRWFYTNNPDRSDYDAPGSNYHYLRHSLSWVTSPTIPITTIPRGTYYFGVVGLDSHGDPIRSTAVFAEFTITGPREYTMEFIRPNEPTTIDIFDDDNIRPRWGPVTAAATPEAVILRIVGPGGLPFETTIRPYRDEIDISAADILISFPTFGEELYFEVFPVVGTAVVPGDARSTNFRIVRRPVTYTLRFEEEPNPTYREGDNVRVRVSCTPTPRPGEDLSLHLVSPGVAPRGITLEPDNSGNWIANISELNAANRADFVFELYDTASTTLLGNVRSREFEVQPRIDVYTITLNKNPDTNIYTVGDRIELSWNCQPEMVPTGELRLYVVEADPAPGTIPAADYIDVVNTQTGTRNEIARAFPSFPTGTRVKFVLQSDPIVTSTGTRTFEGETTPFVVNEPVAPLEDLRVVRAIVNGRSVNSGNVVRLNPNDNLSFHLVVDDGRGTELERVGVTPTLSNRGIFTTGSPIGNRNTGSGGVADFGTWHIKPDAGRGEECVISFGLLDNETPARGNPDPNAYQFTVKIKRGTTPTEKAVPQLTIDGRELGGGSTFDVDLRSRDEVSLYVRNVGRSGNVSFFATPSHNGLSILPQYASVGVNPIGQEIVVKVLNRGISKPYSVTITMKNTGSLNLQQFLNSPRITINFRMV
jgi:hypothetical protein